MPIGDMSDILKLFFDIFNDMINDVEIHLKAKSTLYIRNPNKGIGLRKHSQSYFGKYLFLRYNKNYKAL